MWSADPTVTVLLSFLTSPDADARLTDEAHGIEKRSDEFYVVYPASIDDDEDVERRSNGNSSIVVSFLPRC